MPYVITNLCTNDGTCVDVCPVACIHTMPGAPQFYVDPEVCISIVGYTHTKVRARNIREGSPSRLPFDNEVLEVVVGESKEVNRPSSLCCLVL